METVIDIPAEHEANVFGQFDAYAKKIERALHVTLIARGESVKIMGDALKVEKAKKVLPRNWNVEAKEELLDALRGKLGEKNVKVLEKTIDKVGRRG